MSGFIDLYNFDYSSPAAISREPYYNVGASTFNLGVIRRGFKGGTDFEIWDSAAGGTQLTETTDYDLSDIDFDLSLKAGYNVFTKIQVTNVTYQTGFIYINAEVVGSYTDANAKRNYDYVIYDNASFINAFYRSAANLYKIKDGITSIFWKPGNYLVADLFMDGDTFGDVTTNNCLTIQAEVGAEIDFDDHNGSFLVTGAAAKVSSLTSKGDNSFSTTAAAGFFITGNDVILENCIARERVNASGFGNFAGARHRLIGCVAYDLEIGFDAMGRLSNCVAYDNDIGFDDCVFVDSSCWANNNTTANFNSAVYGVTDENCTSGCEGDGTLLFSKFITETILSGTSSIFVAHGVASADVNTRIAGVTKHIQDPPGSSEIQASRTLANYIEYTYYTSLNFYWFSGANSTQNLDVKAFLTYR